MNDKMYSKRIDKNETFGSWTKNAHILKCKLRNGTLRSGSVSRLR